MCNILKAGKTNDIKNVANATLFPSIKSFTVCPCFKASATPVKKSLDTVIFRMLRK